MFKKIVCFVLLFFVSDLSFDLLNIQLHCVLLFFPRNCTFSSGVCKLHEYLIISKCRSLFLKYLIVYPRVNTMIDDCCASKNRK